MIDTAWNDVVFPGNLRNQFREQFGQQLADHLPPVDDNFREVTVSEILHAFDLADQHIGRHWPFLATGLWQHGSHVLLTAYIETSGTVMEAMRGLLSTTTALYPVFSSTMEMTVDGLMVRTRPTYDLNERHWSIFQILSLLSQTSVFKKYAPEEVKSMAFGITAPEDEFSETLRSLATCKVTLGVRQEEAFILFPLALLQKRIGYENKALNKVLFEEIQHQTQLPSYEDKILNDLRRHIYHRFPELLSAEDAAHLLQMSRSTLLRLLKRRNTTYTTVMLDQRKAYVLAGLSQPPFKESYPIRLGFTSQRALNDFCNAAFGTTLRKLKLQGHENDITTGVL